MMALDVSYITSAGSKEINQDSIELANIKNSYCFVLADGVGGYNYGEYASQIAVKYIKEAFLADPTVNKNILSIHMKAAAQYISDVIAQNPSMQTMRTTLSVVYIDDNSIVAGHIGDSRIYIFEEDEIIFYSQDHSLVMDMVKCGDLNINDLRGHPKRNVITSAIGKKLPKKVNCTSFDMSFSENNGILLCSDGFWELLTEDEMIELFVQSLSAEQWLSLMEQRVGNRQSRQSDNYTCIAARIGGKGACKVKL